MKCASCLQGTWTAILALGLLAAVTTASGQEHRMHPAQEHRMSAAGRAASAQGVQAAQSMPPEYQAVLKALGKTGDYKDKVLKVNMPRTDLDVRISGIPVPTAFGFGAWLAMTKGEEGMEVMMGDLVLLEDEVNPVMSALLDNGLEVTALHNHFYHDEPRIFYMHVHGHGQAQDLAARVKPALDLIGTISPSMRAGRSNYPPPQAASIPADGKIDTKRIAAILGHEGEQMGSVYKVTIGRPDLHVTEMGAEINARMGLNTWAAFHGSDDKAIVAGDIAMTLQDVTPVLKALRKNALEVVAIHNHMMDSNPMIYFLHYWGIGPAARLASGVRDALDVLGRGVAGR